MNNSKQVLTFIQTASGLNDILSITLFGITFGFGFKDSNLDYGSLITEENWGAYIMPPIEIIGGLLLGLIIGVVITTLEEFKPHFRTILILSISIALVF